MVSDCSIALRKAKTGYCKRMLPTGSCLGFGCGHVLSFLIFSWDNNLDS